MREGTLPFESDPKPRELPLWFTAAGLLWPFVWLLGFWSLVLRARLATGEWPHGRSGNFFEGTMQAETIDPSALGLHADAVLLSTVGLLPACVVVLLCLCVSIFDRRLRQPPWMIAMFFAASAVAWLTIRLDPGGYITWFMD